MSKYRLGKSNFLGVFETTAIAPLFNASSTNALPSLRSPSGAKKRLPGVTRRLSVTSRVARGSEEPRFNFARSSSKALSFLLFLLFYRISHQPYSLFYSWIDFSLPIPFLDPPIELTVPPPDAKLYSDRQA